MTEFEHEWKGCFTWKCCFTDWEDGEHARLVDGGRVMYIRLPKSVAKVVFVRAFGEDGTSVDVDLRGIIP